MAQANIRAVITAEDRASSVLSKFASGVNNASNQAAASFGGIAVALGGVLRTVVAVGATGSAGIGAMTAAAFDQVRQVENASFALRAYEKDASKVNMILSDLVKFARSDMGVLFQREDLFKAASNLRGFGDVAENVVGHVKTLSKGVSLGMTTFDELSQIIGRATQQGKVSAEIFDMLAQRGIILDSSFRGAAKTSEELYNELNRVLPDSLLEGRAKTIDGAFIRLGSAFRDLGSDILGVNKDTSTFIEGGLGDRFIKIIDQLRLSMKDPALKETFVNFGNSIAVFAEKAIPVIKNVFMWFIDNASTVSNAIIAIGAAFIAAKIAEGISTIGAAFTGGPFGLIAGVIIAVVGALTFLEEEFGLVSGAIEATQEALRPLYDFLSVNVWPIIQDIATFLGTIFINAWNSVKKAWDDLNAKIPGFTQAMQALGIILLVAVVAPIAVVVASIIGFITVVMAIATAIAFVGGKIAEFISFAVEQFTGFINATSATFGAVIGTIINVFNNIVNTVRDYADRARRTVVDIWNGIVNFFRDIPGNIGRAIGYLGDTLYNAGRDVINGLKRGIESMWNSAVSFVSNLGGNIASAFKEKLGIHSPSKVFAEYGANTVAGLVKGISDSSSDVEKEINKMGDSMNREMTLSSPMTTGVFGAGGQNGSASNPSLFNTQSPANGNTNVSATVPTINVTIQAGAFVGSQVEARKFATMIMQAYSDAMAAKGTI